MKQPANFFKKILPLPGSGGSGKATIPLASLLLLGIAGTAQAQGTAFMYQGQLASSNAPANGSYDLTFALWTASSMGAQKGTTITNTDIGVTNGLFGVMLDFGNWFNGTSYWLQIGVRASGGGAFTTLSPRQELTPTPYAIMANSASNLLGTLPAAQLSAGTASISISGNAATATTANNFSGSLAGNVTGTQGATVVATIGGVSAVNVASGANTANNATSANTASRIVQRDGSGNFSAQTIALSGNLALPSTSGSSAGVLSIGGTRFLHAFGTDNMFVGSGAGNFSMSGFNNTAVGGLALYSNTSGANNIALGYQAGGNISTGSYNIDIGNLGNTNDNNIIRIGTPGVQNNTFIAGVINGDGSGLTNIPATALVAAPPSMALIPAGTFTMGDSLDGESDAIPTVTVTVSAFYMDVNLVSYSQWQSVYYWATSHGYGFDHAGSGRAANHPVLTVDWYDCVKWCNARSQQAGKTPVYYTDAGMTQVYTTGEVTPFVNWSAKGYRLPTEAEWEKAARGGLSGQRFPWGNVITENLANYYGNTADSYDLGPNGYNAAFTNGVAAYTSPVSYFAPNGYGLYDMAGNVFQWCWDWKGTPYGGGTDPRGPASGSGRVLRGGVWHDIAYGCRTAYRGSLIPSGSADYFGFRSVLPSDQ